MSLYVPLFIAFLLQEPISSNALLLQAYQLNYNVWIIHLLFVTATLFDVVFFYHLGVFVHDRFSENRVVLYIKRKTQSFLDFAGQNGQKIALFIYGPIIFPLSAFIAPWIGVSFWNAFVFLSVGDLLFWYGSEWVLVLGVKSVIPNPNLALSCIFALSVVITFSLRYLKKKPIRKRKGSVA